MAKETLDNYSHLDYDEKDCLVHSKSLFKITSDLIRSHKPNKVLDIGVCSALLYKEYLPELLKSGSVYGIDIEEEFLDTAEQRGVHVKRCNLDKEPIPFEDGMFDVVVCDSLLEHTLNPKGLMNEITRVLKKDGKVILCVPNATSILRRIDVLRGRNPFYPMIDNLFHKDFMKRCALFYSAHDIKWIIEKYFELKKIIFLDKTSHDPKTITVFSSRIISKFIPELRDVIIVEATKK